VHTALSHDVWGGPDDDNTTTDVYAEDSAPRAVRQQPTTGGPVSYPMPAS
jgi:hypothetical protein